MYICTYIYIIYIYIYVFVLYTYTHPISLTHMYTGKCLRLHRAVPRRQSQRGRVESRWLLRHDPRSGKETMDSVHPSHTRWPHAACLQNWCHAHPQDFAFAAGLSCRALLAKCRALFCFTHVDRMLYAYNTGAMRVRETHVYVYMFVHMCIYVCICIDIYIFIRGCVADKPASVFAECIKIISASALYFYKKILISLPKEPYISAKESYVSA